jgi:cysteine synthase
LSNEIKSKNNNQIHRPGILSAVGNTPLVEMPNISINEDVRLFAKLEGANPTGSVKDRIALKMIEMAEEKGDIKKGDTVLEPSSGNTGIGLAMVCKLKGYHLEVVLPENVSRERIQLLTAYGAKIHFSEGAKGTNGAIEVAKEMVSVGNYYFPYQYGNEANPLAHYYGTGLEIIEQLPEVDVFVAGLGTGGTLMGTGRRLKEFNPEIKIVAAAPQPGDSIQALRSLEDGFVPPILDLNLLDARIMVSSEEAFKTTKRLLDDEGIFAGISCGAVVASAIKIAKRLEKGNIVCLLADAGWKYLSTDLWTKEYLDLEEELEGKLWW